MSPSDRAVLRPSKTADLAAAIRALHVRRSPSPVFDDNLAHAMCGPFWKSVVSSRLLSWLVVDVILGRLKPIVPTVYVRARYGEDCLEAAVGRGISQYVIVGAGYETFAARRKDLMARLAVYELDQGGTQEMKRRRMREAGIATPDGVRYVAADLNAETLHDALGRTDFDFARPALFSWFGVTFYLDRDAIRRTLESIAAKMAPGSAVMFDYLANAECTPTDVRELRQGCAEFVARRGEPWVSSFDPAEIPGFLAELGYAAIENLEPDMIGPRYRSRHPDLIYPPVIGFCHAATSAQ